MYNMNTRVRLHILGRVSYNSSKPMTPLLQNPSQNSRSWKMSLYPYQCLPQPITRYSIINPHLPSLPQPTIHYSIPSPHPFSSLPQSTIRYSITNSHPISSLPQPTIRYSRPNPHPISSLPQLTIRYSIPNPHSIYSPPQPNIRYGLNPIKVSTAPNSAPSFRAKDPKDITILVVGSTGYIGRFVVKELVRRGFNVISVARERSGIRGRSSKEDTLQELQGSTVCFSDVTDSAALEESLAEFCGARTIDVVVSCLASRSGGVKDSWKIDYEATRNSLVVARKYGAAHFVLLSAICVQKPLLEFQRAKLKFEAELMEEAKGGDFTYSIVRPTAFFKSLGGQVELVKDGKPYVMFGDGRLCACKPISEEDLASFIADCVLGEDKICKILPIGGPGKALTPLEQGEMLFRLLGKEPKFLKVPIGVMDFAIGLLDFLVKIFPVMEDAAEFGKIGRYYAAESMLVVDPETGEYSAEKTPSYGKDTLEDFFEKVIREGMAGQELGEQTIF